jgi:hypothetical protein
MFVVSVLHWPIVLFVYGRVCLARFSLGVTGLGIARNIPLPMCVGGSVKRVALFSINLIKDIVLRARIFSMVQALRSMIER